MKIRITIVILMGIIIGCTGTKKETGSYVYIEVEQLDPSIEKCFAENLYNKWAGLHSLEPHPMKEKCTEPKSEDKHIFKPYSDFDLDKDKPGTNKLMVRVYGDGDTASTFFQVQRYRLEEAGNWQRILN